MAVSSGYKTLSRAKPTPECFKIIPLYFAANGFEAPVQEKRKNQPINGRMAFFCCPTAYPKAGYKIKTPFSDGLHPSYPSNLFAGIHHDRQPD
ncbi:hypothetical protein L4G92_01735 [Neisseria sp. ZJ106]|uniref:Uncharacterized protein n=1 Tax=Neisseria lisongii TaxID=2912188 RepID=A0ABY7RHS8_9NEIS|nr:hypothetical protein [Neisseria lisongii]MCF7520775.1 hypothetical protein [Neisseria lisongii]WCL70713.1 hypothetical protein PJU73_04805 [Neisseria lisongii]